MSVILNEVQKFYKKEAIARNIELRIAKDRLGAAQLAFYEAKEDLQQSGEWADGEIDKLINDRS